MYVVKIVSIRMLCSGYKNDIRTMKRFEKFCRGKNLNIDKRRKLMHL